MLSNRVLLNSGRVIGIILSGCAEPSIDLEKADKDGFFTLNLRDKRDGTTLVLKVTEIKLRASKKK